MTIAVTVRDTIVTPSIRSGATVDVQTSGVGSAGAVGAALRLSVANIDDPSAELATIPGSLPTGTIRIATQDIAGANAYRIYVLDASSATAQSTPNRINRTAGGQWVQIGGKGVAGSFAVETSLTVGGAAAVTGGLTVGAGAAVTGALTASGLVGLGGVTSSNAIVSIGNANPLTGATQIATLADFAGTVAGTSSVRSFYGRVSSASATYTVPEATAFLAAQHSAGASSTITRAFGFIALPQNAGGTGNYALAHTSSPTAVTAGNYFLFDDVGYPSKVSGVWTHTDTTDATSTTAAAAVYAGGVAIAKAAVIGTGLSVGASATAPFSGILYISRSSGANVSLQTAGVTDGQLRVTATSTISIADSGGTAQLSVNTSTGATTAVGTLTATNCFATVDSANAQFRSAVKLGGATVGSQGATYGHLYVYNSSTVEIFHVDSFTPLVTSSAPVSVTSSTASTSTTTGAVVVTGGAAVGGALWVGGLANIAGVVTAKAIGTVQLNLDRADSGTERALTLTNSGAGTKYNFKIGCNVLTNDALEIIPSTAAGGSTYSTAAIIIAGATRAVTIGAAAGANSLSVNGASGQYCSVFNGFNGAGVSFGPNINAGSNSSDLAMIVADRSGSNLYLTVRGDGNIALMGTGSYGGGVKCVFIANATTAPTTATSGGGALFVSAGALKYIGSSGTITTLAAA